MKLSDQFRISVHNWKTHRKGQDYKGRQMVYWELIKRYGFHRVHRHTAQLARAMDGIEQEARREG